jgi:hypothetical protein
VGFAAHGEIRSSNTAYGLRRLSPSKTDMLSYSGEPRWKQLGNSL